jgi:hypothetical protein
MTLISPMYARDLNRTGTRLPGGDFKNQSPRVATPHKGNDLAPLYSSGHPRTLANAGHVGTAEGRSWLRKWLLVPHPSPRPARGAA